jgi:hypothetical protein
VSAGVGVRARCASGGGGGDERTTGRRTRRVEMGRGRGTCRGRGCVEGTPS